MILLQVLEISGYVHLLKRDIGHTLISHTCDFWKSLHIKPDLERYCDCFPWSLFQAGLFRNKFKVQSLGNVQQNVSASKLKVERENKKEGKVKILQHIKY